MKNLIILYNPYYEKDVIEQQFEENKSDVTYDFTSVVIKYSKTMEKEIYNYTCKDKIIKSVPEVDKV